MFPAVLVFSHISDKVIEAYGAWSMQIHFYQLVDNNDWVIKSGYLLKLLSQVQQISDPNNFLRKCSTWCVKSHGNKLVLEISVVSVLQKLLQFRILWDWKWIIDGYAKQSWSILVYTQEKQFLLDKQK